VRGQPDDRSTEEIIDGLRKLYARAAAAIATADELCRGSDRAAGGAVGQPSSIPFHSVPITLDAYRLDNEAGLAAPSATTSFAGTLDQARTGPPQSTRT
jgi:hypothetical protein